MNRPMATMGFSLFFTLIAVGLLGYIVSFYLFVSLSVLLLVAALVFRRRLPTAFLAITISAIVACAFFCTYTTFVYKRVVNFAGAELATSFEIIDIQGGADGSYNYTGKVVNSGYRGLNGAKVSLVSPERIDAQVCDVVNAKVTLEISGSNNKSSHLYYKSSGIFLKAYIREGYEVEKNPDKGPRFYFYEIKQSVSQIISANLDEKSASVVNSILLGDTNGLDVRNKTNFQNVGISHIFCVSGLHVTLIASLAYRFLSLLVKKRRALYVATLLSLWAFVAVTGFSYSSIRSGIMLSVYYVGRMINRDSDSLNSLGFAALVICILNPYSATNISLLYSFFATLGILVMPKPKFVRIRSKIIRSLLGIVIMSVNVMVFTLPIQIFSFGTATLISPIANCLIFFVVTPLVACTIIAIILSVFTSILSSLFFLVCAGISRYLVLVADLVSEAPIATVDASTGFVKPLVVITVVVMLAVIYMRFGKRVKIFAASFCGMMFFLCIICYNIFFKPVLKVTVVDSGCATSVVLMSGRSAVVVGCGGRSYTASEISYVLRQRAASEVDLLILPSKERDVAVNIDELSRTVDINTVICGEDYGLLYSIDVGEACISQSGEYVAGDIKVCYDYRDDGRLTYIEVDEKSLLIVTAISDGYEIDEKWQDADAIISVGMPYTTNNERINILCVDKNGDYPVSEVCYKDGGNIIIEFLKNEKINCERRA